MSPESIPEYPPVTQPLTPSAPRKALPKYTPRSARSTGDKSTVTETRLDVAEAMDREMLTCKLEEFQCSYLPFVPSQRDVDTCARMMVDKGKLVLQNNKYQWRGRTAPEDDSRPESTVFKFLERVAGLLAEYSFSGSREDDGRIQMPELEYKDCPHNVVKSGILGANFKIDGCFRLKQGSQLSTMSTGEPPGINAPDIVVAAEFKKKSQSASDTVDNRKKLVSAASHIMNDDPRRAFMFGITIEGSMMSLWYFSRSHSTMTEPVNYMESPENLISVFLSFLFGDPRHLGYDPDVHRIIQGGEVQYEYKLRSEKERATRYYRTFGTLSSFRALGITGRMTRVWRAREISDFEGEVIGQKDVALKDVWLDVEAQTECSIQEQIFEAIRNPDNETLSRIECLPEKVNGMIKRHIKDQTYDRFFMTIDWDQEQGMITKAKPTSANPIRGLFKAIDTGSLTSRSNQLQATSAMSDSDDNVFRLPPNRPTEGAKGMPPRKYAPKKRYLLVYSDVGMALHRVGDLQTLFRALQDTFFVFMFIANWVHRDVSTGNIIVFGVGSKTHGRLSDLEYAKKFNSNASISSDPKTGTPFFMAYEIISGVSLRSAHLDATAEPSDSTFVLGPDGEIETSVVRTSDVSTPMIIYCIQHDLESLWWIALWFLLARVDHEPSRDHAEAVFINQIALTPERMQIFQNPAKEMLEEILHERLHVFASHLELGRSDLLRAYRSRPHVSDPATYTGIFNLMLRFIAECYTSSKDTQDLLLTSPGAGTGPDPSSINCPPPNPTPDATPDAPQAPYKRPFSGTANENNNAVGSRKRPRQDDLPGDVDPLRLLNYRSP